MKTIILALIFILSIHAEMVKAQYQSEGFHTDSTKKLSDTSIVFTTKTKYDVTYYGEKYLKNMETNKITRKKIISEDNNKIEFQVDKVIFYSKNKVKKVAINDISKIKFNLGHPWLEGLIIGSVSGFTLYEIAAKRNDWSGLLLYPAGVIGFVISTIAGASIVSSDDYDISKLSFEKKKEKLIKIFSKYQKKFK